MKSVTQRIKEVKQPRGGYVNPRLFETHQLSVERQLNDEENIHATLVGLCVDYMTRFVLVTPVSEVLESLEKKTKL